MNTGVAIFLIIILLVLLILALIWAWNTDQEPTELEMKDLDNAAQSISFMERKWVEYSLLTRLYMIEKITGYPGSSLTSERLKTNQATLGANMAIFFGKDIGNQYGELLTKKTNLNGQLFDQMSISKDTAAIRVLLEELNGRIASLISTTSEGLIPSANIVSLLADFDEIISKEATAIVKKDYTASIKELNNSIEQSGKLSNYLGGAIWYALNRGEDTIVQ